MAIEIEKKYRLTDAQQEYVLSELAAAGAQFVGDDFEENIIYGGHILDEQAAILRIRRTRDRTILTYKRRIANDLPVKQQIEHESEFTDGAGLADILNSLGFEPRLVYEKRRKTWKFGTVEIVLDQLPFGQFMEIEGSITGIKEAEIVLGIEGFEVENETYPRLTARLGIQCGNVIESRFSADGN
jgi:adenylate cyclase, class 2